MSKILELNLTEVMSERFGNYSKYVIQDRALPDARDGLKPVHRRILFSMFGLGLTNDKAYKKSARIVGEVIGKYHPHGDSSVYEAMVRLSQEWKMNMPLVDMHGNKGSVDGDSAAAMRYTETRLAKLSNFLLNDIKKDTVPFVLNFDDSEKEPSILPGRFPNLLVNGAIGIASGYSTNIPPHNLNEVIDAIVTRIKSPNCRLESILQVLKAPDFPTRGKILGVDEIPKIYREGKGKLVISGTYDVDHFKKEIVITELPFETNKADLVRKIDEISLEEKVPGILEVRDETDRKGLRILIRCSSSTNMSVILKYILKNTDLQKNYNMQLVAIKDRKPLQMGILELIDAYIDHQIIVETKRINFDLAKAKERKEIVDGLIIAIESIDKVIALIRKATDKKTAKEAIISKFKFSELQAESIVVLRLYRLTSTDITELKSEKLDLIGLIKKLEELLSKEENLRNHIIKLIREIKKEFGVERKTEIVLDGPMDTSISEIDVIPQQDVVVAVTKNGYLKQSTVRSYSSVQHEEYGVAEDDGLIFYSKTSNHNNILLVLSNGKYVVLPIYKLSEMPWKNQGNHINTLTSVESGVKILNAIVFKYWNEVNKLFLVTSSKNGLIKRSNLIDFETSSNKSIKCMGLKNNDEVVSAIFTNGFNDLIIISEKGFHIKYPETELSITGVKTSGVKAISLKNDDTLAATILVDKGEKQKFVIVSNNGYKIISTEDTNYALRITKGSLIAPQLKTNPYKIIDGGIIYKDSKCFVLSGNNKKTEIAITKGAKRHTTIERMCSATSGKIVGSFIENSDHNSSSSKATKKVAKQNSFNDFVDEEKSKPKKDSINSEQEIMDFLNELE